MRWLKVLDRSRFRGVKGQHSRGGVDSRPACVRRNWHSPNRFEARRTHSFAYAAERGRRENYCKGFLRNLDEDETHPRSAQRSAFLTTKQEHEIVRNRSTAPRRLKKAHKKACSWLGPSGMAEPMDRTLSLRDMAHESCGSSSCEHRRRLRVPSRHSSG